MLSRTSRHLRALSASALLVAGSCVTSGVSHVAPSAPRGPVHASYQVAIHKDGTLDVAIKVSSGAGGSLVVDAGMEGFVSAIRVDGAPVDARWDGATLVLARAAADACARQSCTIAYRFDLPKAAEAADDSGEARRVNEMFVTCPSAWLLRPAHASDDSTFELQVDAATPLKFAFGIPADAGKPASFHGMLQDLDEPPYAAIGEAFRRIDVPDVGPLEVLVAGPEPHIGDRGIAHWVSEAVKNLRAIYDGYPTHRVLVIVEVEPGSRIGPATTMGNGGAAIEVRLGDGATADDTGDDWILTHEMLHTTFPGLARAHHWAEEGMATYLEPIARARRGAIPVERVWGQFLGSMHLGEPDDDDQGLDQTPSWGRTYWGGALFWFVSDVEIRKATKNARGAPDFFAEIYRQADIATRWPMSRVVEVGDATSGTDVLAKLYATHATHPVKIDLDRIFHDLGVRVRDGEIVLDDDAPLADIRKGIVSPPAKP